MPLKTHLSEARTVGAVHSLVTRCQGLELHYEVQGKVPPGKNGTRTDKSVRKGLVTESVGRAQRNQQGLVKHPEGEHALPEV